MARILRGEIRWAQLDAAEGNEQKGRRPVLIVSHDVFNARSGTVIAIPLTSKEQRVGFPLAFELAPSGLPKRSWLKPGQVRTLSTQRVGRKLKSATPAELQRAIDGLNEIIG